MTELEMWQAAAKAEFGISITTNDLKFVEKHLYAVRKEHPEFLSIRICIMGNSLWLVKDTVKRLDYAGATG